MSKGKAIRIYSVNKAKLKEAIEAIDELINPLKEQLKEFEIKKQRSEAER